MARLATRTRCNICRKMSRTPEPKSSQSPAAQAAPPPQAVRGYWGLGLVRVRVNVGRMQAAPAPQPPRRRLRRHPPALSPPSPGAGARHHLPAGDGVREGEVGAPVWAGGGRRGAQRTTQWRTAERGRAGRAEQRSSDGAPRRAGGSAREWEPAKWTGRQRGAGQGCRARRKRHEQAQWARCARDRRGARGAAGKGTREGRTPRSRQQGARESRASRQREGEGRWPWVHGVTGIPRERDGFGGELSSLQPLQHFRHHPTLR